jgi:hypothetical protein
MKNARRQGTLLNLEPSNLEQNTAQLLELAGSGDRRSGGK